MRRLFVAGNWKMNKTLATSRELASGLAKEIPATLAGVDVAVCPPYLYLSAVGADIANSGVTLGAQDASHQKPGAYTGEVAAEMLVDIGCRWVILGHSERRQYHAESNELISKKVLNSIAKGLDVILCVGETLAERNENRTESVLDAQMNGSLAGVDAGAMAKVAHLYLRQWMTGRFGESVSNSTRILYGGSVKPDNALSLMQQPNVDGALVGGASLSVKDFLPIVKAAEQIGAK
jgi:triosephosphate isomerase